MLVGAPSFQKVEEEFKSRIDRKVLVMHGASHDVGKLKKAMRDFQFPLVLDSQRLFRNLDKSPVGYGLSELFDHYSLRATLASNFMGREACDHRACYDALGLAYLLVILLRRHKPNATLDELKEVCEYKPR
jgi:DNA polymerase III epsilon subunit-like protein